MKNRQAFATYRNITALFIALSTTACGGGGSGGDSPNTTPSPETSERNQTESPAAQYSAAIRTYETGEVTEANAEKLVKESVGILDVIAENHADYLEELIALDPSQLTAYDPGEEISLTDFMCDQGGTSRVIQEQGQMDITPDSFAYFGAGDRFIIERVACASSQLESSYRFHGSATAEVLSGYYDWFGHFADPNSEIKQVFDEYGIVSASSTNSYIHGDVQLKLTDGEQISLQGESLKVRQHGIVVHEYYLGDYQLTLNKVDGLPSYRTAWTMTGAAPFQFGLGSVGQEFEMNILSGIVFDSWLGKLQGGSYQLRSGGRTLQVELFSSHLTYKLDLDQDGVFEIESMLNDSEY